ncbi:TetR/AcrR family transcriptional regulator [Massilia endophytica]|uniref:TetR/AcrR family transcriptional regulator n=1 Tax=Massilia endophytica TaxID=2899220 RepID=UPI001E5F7602|nr:TetR/AcrR family transcriptional regulator [Massilia endophytica]UGQ48605.1 TetR/AcrR family transcriptional regulator [Massilia endophytica]
MARRPPVKPRKEASQQRSRATVDALVEATARILVRDGYDKASTNRIAEEAGVSIGSLYQYFPAKEALVAAVIDRHQSDIMGIVHAAVAEAEELPLRDGVHRLVAAAIEAHSVDPKLHRVLAEQLPHTGTPRNVEAHQRENFAMVRNYLEKRKEEIRVPDLNLATYMCATSIEALAHNAVLHQGDKLSKEAIGLLVNETARLVTGYLQSPP